MFTPVILCGGAGTRLWPLSRELYPKQLLALTGTHTMLQETLLRLEGLPASPPVRSEEHTSELQSRFDLVCRLLLEKKNRSEARRRVLHAGWSLAQATH